MKFKPNPARQAILIGLALAGIGIGYGMGFLLKKDIPKKPPVVAEQATRPEPAPATTLSDASTAGPAPQATTVLPETHAGEGPPRAYEEALPKEIVHFPALTVPPRIEPAAPVSATDAPEATHGTAPARPEDSAATDPPAEATALTEPVVPQDAQAPRQAGTADTAPDGADPSLASLPSMSAEAEGWLANALIVPLTDKPKIAIVIDDMGVDQRRSHMAAELTGPLTLSFLTYANDLPRQTREAREAGHELMLHVPMEPASRDVDPGPNVLLSGVPEPEIQAALKWGLDQFSGYVGVNNHMGSKFTSDLEGMKVLMRELRKRKMIFLDSVTSGSTKGQIAAHQFGVPFIARNIFLDHIDDISEIRVRLQEVKRLATRQGYAVAIGHPRDATLKALAPWLKTIENEGYQLVPISALIRQVSEDTSIASTSTHSEVPIK